MNLIQPPKIIPVARTGNKAFPVFLPFQYSFFPVPQKSALTSIRLPRISNNLSFTDLRLELFVPPSFRGTNIPFTTPGIKQ
jgi:hypothetical protein